MQLPARPPDVFQVPVAGTWRQGVDVEEFLSLQSWGTSPTPLATPAGAVGKTGAPEPPSWAIGHIAAVPSHRAISSCQLGLCPSYTASYSHPWGHRTRSIADARWLGCRRTRPPPRLGRRRRPRGGGCGRGKRAAVFVALTHRTAGWSVARPAAAAARWYDTLAYRCAKAHWRPGGAVGYARDNFWNGHRFAFAIGRHQCKLPRAVS